MTTRRELTEAVGERYRRSERKEKQQILDEFVELTGYHRKHAIRVLCKEPQPPRAKPGPNRRYDDEVRAALITLWEAGDRHLPRSRRRRLDHLRLILTLPSTGCAGTRRRVSLPVVTK